MTTRLAGYARPALTWVTAAVLYAVISYPYHAVLLTSFGSHPPVVYAVLCILGVVLFFTHRRSAMPVEHARLTWLIAAGFVVVLGLSYLSTHNPTAVREFLLLVVVVLLLTRIRGIDSLTVLRALVYIATIVLLPAIIIVALFYAGIIDWPTWRVERLGLAEVNPVLIRGTIGNFEYYLPWWLAFVPHAPAMNQGFGLVFVRQPLVYIEPTDTWLYCTALFWIAVADQRMPLRRLCIGILGIALAASFSVAGVLATVGAIMVCAGVVLGGRMLVLAVLGGIGMLFSLLPLDVLLGLISENKATQLEFYTDNLMVLSNPTMFGNADFTRQGVNYGLLAVLDRFGMVGMGYLVLVLAVCAFAAFHLLNDSKVLGWKRFPLFIGSTVTLAMTAKYPGIVPAMPAICLAAALSFRQYQMNPFDAAAIRS